MDAPSTAPPPGLSPPVRQALDYAKLIQTALAGTGTFVWEWDLDSDRLVDIHLGAQMLGWGPQEVGGTQAEWNRLIHPNDLAANDAAYLRHAQGEVDTYEHVYRARCRDGSWRWVQERGRIVERHADGRPRRMVGTQTDITEPLRAREALDIARQEAAVSAAANRTKTEFLSRMSHELRTPLHAVLGFAQLMEIDAAEPPTATQRRRLGLIRDAGAHLLQMISELLDLTRIEAGGLALAHETVALRALTAQTLEMMHTQADAVGVTLALQPAAGDAPPDDEVLACGDTTRVRQVLLNLLGNAIKYNRRGGQVWVSLSTAEPCSVQLMVADTGMGIAAAELPHVFEPFRRGRHVRSDIDGAGIGLAVTQALVQAMGGHIEASSREGEGSRFVVTLPAAPPTPPPSVPAP